MTNYQNNLKIKLYLEKLNAQKSLTIDQINNSLLSKKMIFVNDINLRLFFDILLDILNLKSDYFVLSIQDINFQTNDKQINYWDFNNYQHLIDNLNLDNILFIFEKTPYFQKMFPKFLSNKINLYSLENLFILETKDNFILIEDVFILFIKTFNLKLFEKYQELRNKLSFNDDVQNLDFNLLQQFAFIRMEVQKELTYKMIDFNQDKNLDDFQFIVNINNQFLKFLKKYFKYNS